MTRLEAEQSGYVVVAGVWVKERDLCAGCRKAMRDGLVKYDGCKCSVPMCGECIEALPVSCRVNLYERGDRLGDDDYRAQGECESCAAQELSGGRVSALPETATELWVQCEQAKRDEALARMLAEIAQAALVKARAERDAFEAEVKVLRSQLEAVRAVIGGVQ